MGINITNEMRTKPGCSDELIALLRELLPATLAHGGAEEISIRQDQEDPDYIVSVQRWHSREAYQAYWDWRTEEGGAARVRALLEEPQKIRYFDEVLYARPVTVD